MKRLSGEDGHEQSSALVAATPVTTRDSQWMDAASETVMNIIDKEYSNGIEGWRRL